MTESSPTPIFYGSAKAEQAKVPKKESKIVTGVRKALDTWLERIGPKSVENHFVKAHEKILATLNSDQRKEVFAKEADTWRKQGKILGIAATTIDASLVALGLGLTYMGFRDPQSAFDLALAIPMALSNKIGQGDRFQKVLEKHFARILPNDGDNIRAEVILNKIGMGVSTAPSIASLGILLGSGPGHWLAHLAAEAKNKLVK